MPPTTADRPAPRPGRRPADRRRLRHAARLWGLLTLGGIVVVGVLVLWHLVRRGRLVRDRLGPPRPVRPLDRLE